MGLISLCPLSNIDPSASLGNDTEYLGDGLAGPLDTRVGLKYALFADDHFALAAIGWVALPFGEDLAQLADTVHPTDLVPIAPIEELSLGMTWMPRATVYNALLARNYQPRRVLRLRAVPVGAVPVLKRVGRTRRLARVSLSLHGEL